MAAIAVAGLLIGVFVANVSWIQAGHSFGFYLGPLAVAAILAPYLALMSAGALRQSPIAAIGWACVGPAAYGLGATLAWLIGGRGHDPAPAIAACGIVLITFTLALAEGTLLLRVLLRSRLTAGFAAILIGGGWLTWPIWMSHAVGGAFGQSWVNRLTSLHPLLAMNGALPSAGPWTQQSIAYQLTNLGQDVYYAFPSTVWSCVIFQISIAIGFALLAGTGIAILHRLQR